MKLKKVKIISYISIGAVCALLLAMMIMKSFVLGYLASALLIVAAIFQRMFWKCPFCGKFLGRLDDKGKYCRHCGKEIEM